MLAAVQHADTCMPHTHMQVNSNLPPPLWLLALASSLCCELPVRLVTADCAGSRRKCHSGVMCRPYGPHTASHEILHIVVHSDRSLRRAFIRYRIVHFAACFGLVCWFVSRFRVFVRRVSAGSHGGGRGSYIAHGHGLRTAPGRSSAGSLYPRWGRL